MSLARFKCLITIFIEIGFSVKSLAAIIHARTTSTRCPNKHLRDLGFGNTLIDVALNKLSSLSNLEEKYLAVHEKELAERVTDGVEVLHRDFDSIAPGEMHHSTYYAHLENVKSDYIVNFNPCQPFSKLKNLQKCIDWFKNSDCDSAITVKKERNFYWDMKNRPVNFRLGDRLSTSSGPWLYSATHTLVFYRKEYMLTNWELFSNKYDDPRPYVVEYDDIELIDVDTEMDLQLVREVQKKQRRL